MKLTGILGNGSGKLGSSVFSVSAGEQIVRQYQPVVANPNTTSQVNQRAKLKLASQIAASMANVIVIPKNGLQSSRNLFIKKNFPLFSAQGGTAQVSYENLQITDATRGIPAINANRVGTEGSQAINVSLAADARGVATRVIYIVYKVSDDGQLQYHSSTIVVEAGENGTFPGALPYVTGQVVIYAYGMKDRNASATAKYGNYNVATGEDVAKLVMTRTLSASDYAFTATRGTTILSGSDQNIQVGTNQSRVYVTASGNGSVTGAGVFDNGTQVTVTATPNEGSTFLGWRLNGQSSYVSTSASYTFTLQATTDLVAVFHTEGTDTPNPGGGGGTSYE
jgi:hypothetical protein